MRWDTWNETRSHWSLWSLALLGVLMASPARASFTFTLAQSIHVGPVTNDYIKNSCFLTNTGATTSQFNLTRSAVQIPAGNGPTKTWTTSICHNGSCGAPENNTTSFNLTAGQTDSISIYFTPSYVDLENPPYNRIFIEGSGYATLTVDEVGINPVSHTLGAVTDGCDVLVVDDDEGGGVQSFFENAITGRIVGTWRRRPEPSGPETLGKLDNSVSTFPLMVWLTGTGTNTLNSDDRTAIDSYLASGGRLMLSGQDIAFDLCDAASPNRTAATESWFENLFKVNYTNNASGSLALNAVAGDQVAQGLALTLNGGDGANNQTDPDVVTALAGSNHVWTYGTGGDAAVRVTSLGVYRAAYFGFGFEAISSAANRTSVMKRTLDWLSYSPITDVSDPRPRPSAVVLEAPSPNPSFTTTTVAFSLSRSGPVTLRIADLAGRVVRTLENGPLSEGRHVAMWNGQTDDGRQAASGLYLLELRSAHGVAVRKLVRSR